MRQGTNPRRGRGRGGGRRNNNTGNNHAGVPNKNQNFSSNGPNERVNGNAKTVYEKYCALAVEAGRAHDRVLAETYYQHAEHYYRIMAPYMPEQKAPADAETSSAKSDRVTDQTKTGQGQEQESSAARRQPRRAAAPKPPAANGAEPEEEDRSGVERLVATPVKPRRNTRRKAAETKDSAASVEAE